MQEVQVFEDFYNCDISFLFGGTIHDVNGLMAKRHSKTEVMEDDSDACQWHENSPQGDNEVFYIWVNEPSWDLVGHEILHLVFDIMRSRGIEYHEDTEDAQAYLQGKIFKMIGPKLPKLC